MRTKFTNTGLTKEQVIQKLKELPDLPIVFMGQFSAFGIVYDVHQVVVRKCKDGYLDVIDDRSTARNYYGEGKMFDNWLNGEEIEVIAIIGI